MMRWGSILNGGLSGIECGGRCGGREGNIEKAVHRVINRELKGQVKEGSTFVVSNKGTPRVPTMMTNRVKGRMKARNMETIWKSHSLAVTSEGNGAFTKEGNFVMVSNNNICTRGWRI